MDVVHNDVTRRRFAQSVSALREQGEQVSPVPEQQQHRPLTMPPAAPQIKEQPVAPSPVLLVPPASPAPASVAPVDPNMPVASTAFSTGQYIVKHPSAQLHASQLRDLGQQLARTTIEPVTEDDEEDSDAVGAGVVLRCTATGIVL